MFGLFRKKSLAAQAPTQRSPDVSVPVASNDLALVIPMIKAIVGDDPSSKTLELPEDDAPIASPFVAELMIFYVLDLPDRFEYINNRFLKTHGLSREQLHSLALQNLPKRIPKIEMHGSAPCHMITAGGNLEATLLLLDDIWHQLAEHLPGDPMAAVPSRDLLFVTGSAFEGANQFMSDMANKPLADSRYALSKCVLVRRSGSWAVHAPAH